MGDREQGRGEAVCGRDLAGLVLGSARSRPRYPPRIVTDPSAAASPAAAPSLPPLPAAERWFAEEVRPLEPALRAYLHRRYPTLADTDDVVQESFLKTFLAWQRGHLTSVRGFLFTVAGNATVSLFRRRRPFVALPSGDLPAVQALTDPADVIAEVCGREELELVAEAIATLPGRCRQVAVLRLLHGRDCRAIAAELGITEQTVRVQLSRAMRRCARQLRDRDATREGRR